VKDLRTVIVHLDRRTAEAMPVDGGIREASVGGAAVNLALIERHGREAIVFGAGPLTGTLAPASALLIGSFRPGAASGPAAQAAPSQSIRHVPLLVTAGPDFRCSGIDHLVILGTAERPTLLHLDGGRVLFVDPPPQPDGMSLRTSLRRTAPPFRSAILTGKSADAGAAFASVSIDAKGSLDKVNLAGAMAAKNLRGLLLGGTGGVAFAADDLRRSLEIAGKVKTLRKKGLGFDPFVRAAGGGDSLKSLKGARIQEAACFHCPAPCMAHARFAWSDPRRPQGEKREESVLLMDHSGWIALAQRRPGTALPLLAESIRLGLDPVAVASLLPAVGEGGLSFDIDLLAALAQGTGPSQSGSSMVAALIFGGSPILAGTGDESRRRAALALVLGLCPIFLQRFPETAGDLAAFHPDIPTASLDRAAEGILARG